MRRVRGVALAIGVVVAAASPSSGAARQDNVSFLRIIRVTQEPYQPVAFRVWVKAPVNHHIWVAIKIFDTSGNPVYTPKGASSPGEASYVQPYYSTSLTLKWKKFADDGSRLPHGQRFAVLAFASDGDTNQKLFRSSPYYFTLTS
jgi:hypothetical protein